MTHRGSVLTGLGCHPGRRPSGLPAGRAAPERAGRCNVPVPATGLARDLPETTLHVASPRPMTPPSTAPLTCADVWEREVLYGVVDPGASMVSGSWPAATPDG